ncbi:MAG: hypothetical protein ACREJV_02150 [Candidatus Rokuibacteriota bacterium]
MPYRSMTGDRHAGVEEGVPMQRRFVLLLLGAIIVLAGCATGEEWTTWKSQGAHFASGDHLYFSVRNREVGAARVTRQDVATARSQGWWGRPVTVSQEQILER